MVAGLPFRDYLDAVLARLLDVLGDDLAALWLIGSGATGGFEERRSDIDLIVVAARPLHVELRRRLARELSHSRLQCPARKLELVLYPREELESPGRRPRFGLNLNTGDGLADHVTLDPGQEAGHWFLLDLAIAREHGRALSGPPPREVVGEIPRGHALDALLESLAWHEQELPSDPDTVLNAVRAWRYAEESVWSSKPEAAAWARRRGPEPALVERALGRDEPLDREAVGRLLEFVRGAVRSAAR